MKLTLLAATAAAVIAGPAFAQSSTGGYVGVEGGVLFPKSKRADLNTVFTQGAQTPAAGTVAAAPGVGLVGVAPVAPVAVTGSTRIKYKRGYDIDAIAGYDFGLIRLEGELGYKRSKIKSINTDPAFITSVTNGLVPAGTTGGTFVFPTDTSSFDLGSHVSVLSGMVNALLDIGNENGPNFYAGAGFGRARVKAFGDRDSAWAYQGIAGVRFPVSDNIELGLKYRYFRTGRLDLDPGQAVFATNLVAAIPNVAAPGGPAAVGSTNVAFTRTATLGGNYNNRFSSHSLLASLIFNFGGQAAPPPPPPPPPAPPPPPPPAPPQTQTCPDGSVILATDACPVPPPPPPPPPPAPERG